MKKRVLQALVFLCVPLGFILIGLFKHEPVYQGKPVAVWFEEMKVLEPDSQGVEALKSLGAESVPMLISALKSKKNGDRFKAAWALAQMGPEARAAIPALIEALDDPQKGVQINATQALAKIGVWREDLVPKLVSRLRDSDLAMSSCSGDLLNSMQAVREAQGLPDTVEPLTYAMAFVKGSSPRTRLMSLPKLVEFPATDPQIRGAYDSLLSDTNGWVREETTKFLKKEGVEFPALGAVDK